MNFYPIDMEHWGRKPYFEFYMNGNKCSYSLTTNLNVTTLLDKLRNRNVGLYPVFIYMVTSVVNAHREFRTSFNDSGQLGYWDQMTPNYTIFHKDDVTFSPTWTEYDKDFSLFHKNYQWDQKKFGDIKGVWAKENVPANTFSISLVPWVSFTGFNLNLYNEGEYLLPIVTGGKYFSDGEIKLLPISLQVHHAVCDGYHVSRFINELQELADSCEEWLG